LHRATELLQKGVSTQATVDADTAAAAQARATVDQAVANLSYEREQLVVIDANDTIFETQATLAISFGSLANAQGVSGTMPTQTKA
jgi:membrane fusion protein, multidrug efflux system